MFNRDILLIRPGSRAANRTTDAGADRCPNLPSDCGARRATSRRSRSGTSILCHGQCREDQRRCNKSSFHADTH